MKLNTAKAENFEEQQKCLIYNSARFLLTCDYSVILNILI